MIDATPRDALLRRRVIQGTTANFIGKFLSIGAWILLTPFILHHLGPSGYGLWVLVGSIAAYAGLLDVGIAGTITKYVAEHRARTEFDQANRLVATALRLYALLGLVAVAISAALAPLLPRLFNVPPEDQTAAAWLVLVMGSTVGLAIPCMTGGAVLRGLQRHGLASFINTAATLLSAAATVVVLMLGGGVLAMAAVNLPILPLSLLASVIGIRRVAPELRFGWGGANGALVRPILSFSSALFVARLGRYLETKTDEIVIGAFLPISFITPYALARKLSEAARMLAEELVKVFLPLAAELHADDDRARLRVLYTAGTRLTLAIVLPVGGTLMALGGPVLSVWVGPAYAGYADLVVLLTLAVLVSTSQQPACSILQGINRPRPLAIMSIGSALANLALSLALVGPLGLTGVALGTLIPTVAVSLGLVMPFAMRSLGVTPALATREIFLPVLVPVVPMAVALSLLQAVFAPTALLPLMVVAGTSSLVYGIGYLAVGASQTERQTCRGLILNLGRFVAGRTRKTAPTSAGSPVRPYC